MKMTVSTSGVIASFNQIEFIEEAIVNLVGQVDELIVVDEQSQDGTYEKLIDLEGRFSTLRVIKPMYKLGVSGACNLAANEARGDILIFQGGDDVSTKHRSETQIAILSDPKVSIAYSLPTIINRYSQVLPNSVGMEFFREQTYADVLAELFFIGNFICAPSVAMRRADFIELGAFQINVDYFQDYGLWLKAAEIGNFVKSEVPVVSYRKHSKNLSKIDYSKSVINRRRDFEINHVLDFFLMSISSESLSGLMESNGIFDTFNSDSLNKALLKSSHSNNQVRLSAVQDLLNLSQDCEVSVNELQQSSQLINHILAISNIYDDKIYNKVTEKLRWI